MRSFQILFLSICCLFFTVACDLKVTSANRSGTLDDDYVEEPLSESSKSYAQILNTSNDIIELIRTKDYDKIHSLHVEDRMKDILSTDKLSEAFDGAYGAMGAWVEYKPQQWGFLPTNENGVDYIVSYKIVMHENGRLDYAFAFEKDGTHTKFVGFKIVPRNKARTPTEA